MDGYDAIGLGDVGIRGIMAHEFGHHVQYELGVSTPDRRTLASPHAVPS